MSFAADVRPPAALNADNFLLLPYEYGQSFLAEGDSWFSLSQIPSYNLLFGLRFPRSALIINCARPGDTMRNMVDWRRNTDFASLLGPQGIFRWSGILLSAGCNDLFNAVEHLLMPFPPHASIDLDQVEQLIDADNFALFETYLRQNFADLVALRDAPGGHNNGVPIFAHTYDYLTPRDAKANFFGFPAFGPWFYTFLVKNNIPASLWIALGAAMQDRLAGILSTLDLPNVHIIDTRGILTPAQLGSEGVNGDWENEIHPTRAGYKKLAQKWNEQIALVLPTVP